MVLPAVREEIFSRVNIKNVSRHKRSLLGSCYQELFLRDKSVSIFQSTLQQVKMCTKTEGHAKHWEIRSHLIMDVDENRKLPDMLREGCVTSELRRL